MMSQGRRSTQRERLLGGMSEIAAGEGYAAATIARVIAHAGVSRPTFYEYFTDKEDCFLAAHREIAAKLLEIVHARVSEGAPELAPQTATRALLDFAIGEPLGAKLLICETLAAGPRALDERDSLIGAIVAHRERARRELAPEVLSPDLPGLALIGGLHGLLAPRLRRGERSLPGLAGELERWIECYERPARQHRWRSLEPGPLPAASPFVSELPRSPPRPLAPGRPGLPSEEVARNQRERILYATAEVSARKGYNAATIADITDGASVDPRVFYRHFRDKQQAFLAAHELGFQHTMAVAAGAFFSVSGWSERIWRSVLARAQFQASHPKLTHVTYVQSYAIGAPAIQRVADTHTAFTIFLQEGNRRTDRAQSQTAMEAIVAASFEIAYHQSRLGLAEQMPRLAYHDAYLCLAPFLGPDGASELLDSKLGRP